MAKKRKNKKQTARALSLIATLLGIVAIAMIFLPNVAIKDTETTYTGLQIAFGYSKELLGAKIAVFEFSFMNLLVYILAAAGVVFSVLGLNGGKMSNFLAAIAFIACGALFFFSLSFCVANETASSVVSWFGGKITDTLGLAYGAIIGAVAALLAGVIQLFRVLVK